MGNVNASEAFQLAEVLQKHILKNCLPLSEDEIPRFRSNELPTKVEALSIFKGLETNQSSYSIILEDVAVSEDENNNAVEITLQVACDYKLGYVGIALLELICHLAFPSAFNKLRTQEQLGYMVSAHARKSAGNSRGLCIEVQSNTALPEYLEERSELWLETFRQELEDMPVERLEMEASAVVSQLLERDTKLSQEIARAWDSIISTTAAKIHDVQPPFDQLVQLAEILTTSSDKAEGTIGPKTSADLKRMLLDFFDLYFSKSSTDRRSIVSRSYGYKSRGHFEANKGKPGIVSSYREIQRVKQYLSLLPSIPYWIKFN
jgi:secreted Zn-dependent insulinase-like peptidase